MELVITFSFSLTDFILLTHYYYGFFIISFVTLLPDYIRKWEGIVSISLYSFVVITVFQDIHLKKLM